MLNNCMTCDDKEQCAKSKEKFKTGADKQVGSGTMQE